MVIERLILYRCWGLLFLGAFPIMYNEEALKPTIVMAEIKWKISRMIYTPAHLKYFSYKITLNCEIKIQIKVKLCPSIRLLELFLN